ncbi:hypothetical protein D5S17_09445 [Pseudonocardiaceae bacterium YIM PH 21723]|nr:hypothetical protein D5S17_09445 [Pseudonocardiaceae bacterium YIM PH 21723]
MDFDALSVGLTAGNLALAYLALTYSRRRDDRSDTDADIDQLREDTLARVDEHLGHISSGVAAVANELTALRADVTDLKIQTAVHSDRLRTISTNGRNHTL